MISLNVENNVFLSLLMHFDHQDKSSRVRSNKAEAN